MKPESEGHKCGRIQLIIGALAIVLLTFAVYLPVVPGSFVMDDERLISSDNPLVNGQFTPASIWFQTDFTLTDIAWWLEHILFGQNHAGYHVVNIVLQAVSALLLWRLLARLKIPGAWLAAALFAVHPVCVNSVARVAELKNTLSLPFFLASLIAWLRYESATLYPAEQNSNASRHCAKGTLWLTLSLVAFVLALMAKTTVVMLPVVMLLCALWQRGRIALKDVLHTLPFFVLSVAFGLMSIWFQKNQALATGPLGLQPASFAERLAGAGYVFWFYLGKDLWPFNLNIEYHRWNIDPGTVTAWLPDLAAGAVFILCLVFWRGWGRHVLFGLGCFVVLLFPALGFFDAQFEALWHVSDHLQYPALPAIVALVAAALAGLNKTVFRLTAVVLLVGCSISCYKYAYVFGKEERLMRDTIAKNPRAWGAHNDYGVILANGGDFSNALNEFTLSAQYNPNNAEARMNLGYAFLLQQNYAAAESNYLAALTLSPHEAEAHKMYARLLQLQGKNAQAIYHLQIAASFKPDADICMSMAALDYTTGNWHRAATDLRQVLTLKPGPSDQITALNNLAWLLATCPDDSVRNGNEAVQHAEEACHLTSFKQPTFINTLAAAYAEAGRFPDAVATAENAINLAKATGNTSCANFCEQLLPFYRAGKAYHERPLHH
jgi:Flp pilus assembly protein TadD